MPQTFILDGSSFVGDIVLTKWSFLKKRFSSSVYCLSFPLSSTLRNVDRLRIGFDGKLLKEIPLQGKKRIKISSKQWLVLGKEAKMRGGYFHLFAVLCMKKTKFENKELVVQEYYFLKQHLAWISLFSKCIFSTKSQQVTPKSHRIILNHSEISFISPNDSYIDLPLIAFRRPLFAAVIISVRTSSIADGDLWRCCYFIFEIFFGVHRTESSKRSHDSRLRSEFHFADRKLSFLRLKNEKEIEASSGVWHATASQLSSIASHQIKRRVLRTVSNLAEW